MEQTQTENDIFGNICSQCGKHYASQYGLRNHIEIVHEGVKYACDQCDFQATKQNNLSRHIQSIHEGVKYDCNQCDQQYAN